MSIFASCFFMPDMATLSLSIVAVYRLAMLLERAPDATLFVFSFHAAGGIRHFHVTGVQTCALPISIAHRAQVNGVEVGRAMSDGQGVTPLTIDRKSVRVGKECRSRWSPYH